MNPSNSIPEWLGVLAWVSTAAVPTAGFATLLLRRQAAALRHLFWLLALCAPLAALPLAWVHPQVAIPIFSPSPEQVSATPRFPARRLTGQPSVAAAADQVLTVPLTKPASSPLSRFKFKLPVNPWVGVWLMGTVCFAARFLLAHIRLRRLVRDQSSPAGEALVQQLGEAKRHLGFHRKVRLLVGPLTPIPFCHGAFQPVINFPESWREWDGKRIQICLSHELAHVVRHDLLTLLIGRLACIVCWFNPLVWLAAGRLRQEAEKAADDLVLARGFDPAVYAAALIALAERHQAAAFSGSALALAMARRNRLSSRVGAILDESLRRRPPGRAATLTISLVALAVLTTGMAVRLTAAAPKGKTTVPEQDLVRLNSRTRYAVGVTAYKAIKAGDIQTIDSFLQRGLNANEDLEYGDSLLFQAVDEYQLDIVKLLLAHGADVNPKISPGDTPARRACWRGYRDIADTLIRAGATVDGWQYATGMGDVAGLEVNDKQQPTTAKEARGALYFAVSSGHENTFDWLWNKLGPLDAQQKDKLLGDLYENAGRWGHPGMLRHLQDLGASPAPDGAKALAGAVSGNHLEAARYLLEAGVSPKAISPKGNMLLRNAAGEGRLEMVRLLLDHGADPTRKDEYGESALSLARKSHPDLVPMLEAAIKHTQETATPPQATGPTVAPPQKTGTPGPTPIDKTTPEKDDAAEKRQRAALSRKVESLIIPQVDFHAMPLTDALEFLRQEAARLCAAEPDPNQRGINVFLKLTAPPKMAATTEQNVDKAAAPKPAPGAGETLGASAISPADRPITLTMNQRPMLEILRAVASQVDMKVKIERYAVSLVPSTEQIEPYVTAKFTVAPSALGVAVAPPPAGNGDHATASTVVNLRPFLEDKGVTFPAGSSAVYRAGTQQLIIRNTEENINRLKVLFPASNPAQ